MSLSQAVIGARKRLDCALVTGRFTSGMTTLCSTTSSFILMKSAARFTGSSSPSAAR